MTRETSASIAAWAETTFGPLKSLERLVERAEQELVELRAAVAGNASPDDIAHEAADVMILLHRLVALVGRDLSESVDAKMTINRARQWAPSGDGVGQHV